MEFFYYEVVIIKKVYINGVKNKSIAEEIGLKKGDYIITINGQEIVDILDYKFIVEDEEYIEAANNENLIDFIGENQSFLHKLRQSKTRIRKS